MSIMDIASCILIANQKNADALLFHVVHHDDPSSGDGSAAYHVNLSKDTLQTVLTRAARSLPHRNRVREFVAQYIRDLVCEFDNREEDSARRTFVHRISTIATRRVGNAPLLAQAIQKHRVPFHCFPCGVQYHDVRYVRQLSLGFTSCKHASITFESHVSHSRSNMNTDIAAAMGRKDGRVVRRIFVTINNANTLEESTARALQHEIENIVFGRRRPPL